RNWAISELSYSAALSSVLLLTKRYSGFLPGAHRSGAASGGSSVRRRERLDAARGADELHHDDDTGQHEQPVENARANRAEREQVGDRPAAGKGGTEHFGADQNRRADHRQHVLPEDAPRALGR